VEDLAPAVVGADGPEASRVQPESLHAGRDMIAGVVQPESLYAVLDMVAGVIQPKSLHAGHDMVEGVVQPESLHAGRDMVAGVVQPESLHAGHDMVAGVVQPENHNGKPDDPIGQPVLHPAILRISSRISEMRSVSTNLSRTQDSARAGMPMRRSPRDRSTSMGNGSRNTG